VTSGLLHRRSDTKERDMANSLRFTRVSSSPLSSPSSSTSSPPHRLRRPLPYLPSPPIPGPTHHPTILQRSFQQPYTSSPPSSTPQLIDTPSSHSPPQPPSLSPTPTFHLITPSLPHPISLRLSPKGSNAKLLSRSLPRAAEEETTFSSRLSRC